MDHAQEISMLRKESTIVIPYTIYPTPYTLHPTPYTLHPTPCTLHPTPYTLHPTPYTLHPKPYILTVCSSCPSLTVSPLPPGVP